MVWNSPNFRGWSSGKRVTVRPRGRGASRKGHQVKRARGSLKWELRYLRKSRGMPRINIYYGHLLALRVPNWKHTIYLYPIIGFLGLFHITYVIECNRWLLNDCNYIMVSWDQLRLAATSHVYGMFLLLAARWSSPSLYPILTNLTDFLTSPAF